LKLRTHINLIVGCLSAAFIALVVSVQLDSTRRAVGEEIAAANIVASQLLGQVAAQHDTVALHRFLDSLGRVRANEILLYASDGALLYQSPLATYKAGREAPKWFSNLLLPKTTAREFTLQDGSRLTVTANASRAILDGWDDMKTLLWSGALALGVLNGLVFWLVSRALAPLPVIADGLSRLQQGDLKYRLPMLQGYESGIIGTAFNDMATAVQEKVAAERHAREAEASLEERREFAKLVEQRLDEERRMIARELHDEFAQSVTAIRSLAVAISTQVPDDKSPTHEAAQVISAEAGRLYDAMHGLIPRLAPLALDTLGLSETLQSMVNEWRQRNPKLRFSLQQNLPTGLGHSAALTIYRIVQEGLSNAIRHAQATQIDVAIEYDERRVQVTILDDGVGLSDEWSRPGRFGLRGLRERTAYVRGTFSVSNRTDKSGVEVRAEIPLEAA
jgi:two-component system sensor histidine kinase UhpB